EKYILFILGCQRFRSIFEREIKEAFLINRISRHRDASLFMKHVGNTAGRREVAVVLGEDAADFRGGAVLVVRGRFHDQSDAAGAVAFINDLVEMLRLLAFASAAF